jgi:uncharacterized protein YecT (DUF1311 family)
MRALTAATLVLTSAIAASAQPAVRPADRTAIDACLQREKETPERCIGIVYRSCSEAPQGPNDPVPPGSTAGRGDCAEREIAVWEAKIDASLTALRAGPLGRTVAQPWNRPDENKRAHAVPGTEIIDDMQRTWLVSRAKLCDTAAMRYEEGTFARVVYATCVNEETARHALWLMKLEND